MLLDWGLKAMKAIDEVNVRLDKARRKNDSYVKDDKESETENAER